MIIDTLDEATQRQYSQTHLWRPWMAQRRLKQVESIRELTNIFADHSNAPLTSFDLEANSLNPTPEQIVGFCFAWNSAEAYYVPTRHDGAPDNLPHEQTEKIILDFIKNRRLVVYNALYEASWFRHLGIYKPITYENIIDAMVVLYNWDADRHEYGLKEAANEILEIDQNEITDVPGVLLTKAKSGPIRFGRASAQHATLYAAADPLTTLALLDHIRKQPNNPETTQPFVLKLDHRVLHTLLEMRDKRIFIDRGHLQNGLIDLRRWSRLVAAMIFKDAGKEFNIGSNPAVAKILKAKGIKLPPTATGKDATGANVLEQLAVEHPICRYILQYRSLVKEASTYAEKIINGCTTENPWIRVGLSSVGVPTGRLRAADNPLPGGLKINSQAIPGASAYETAPCHLVENPPPELFLEDSNALGSVTETDTEATPEAAQAEVKPEVSSDDEPSLFNMGDD